MAIHLRAHAFVAIPLRGLSALSTVSPSAAAEALCSLLDPDDGVDAASPHSHLSKILPSSHALPERITAECGAGLAPRVATALATD
jgi:hypothetical protein